MNTERVKRKISAIFSADVEGYSRLMGDDEEATVRTVEAYRKVLSDLIDQHRGRVVDSPGDNLLAEFGSVVDAVQCAVEVQQILKARNAELPENRRMRFRIGVNLGDVIEEGDRIYGDGINIAARIEGLAEGGGICVSGSAYEQIENKLALGYEYLGEHTVKNITKPIRVYKVPMEPGVSKKKAGLRGWKKVALAAAVVLVLGTGALAAWHFYLRTSPAEVEVASEKTPDPESPQKAPPPVSDKPSIAVLPFVNMSADPKEEFFCDGITENIITSFSKIEDMFVVARNSTFAYKGKPVKVKQVARELGVRYVLEGSIQRSKDRLRINVQLIDADTGNHLWAERYDRKLTEIFALQDEITLKVLEGVRLKIAAGDTARFWSRGTNNLKAYLKVLKASDLYDHYNKNDNVIVQQLCHEAISLDPKYSDPYAMLAFSHLDACIFGWSNNWKECFTRCFEFAQKALSLNEFETRAHIALSIYYGMKKQYDKGVSAGAKAVAIEPNGANANMLYADILSKAGRHEEAIDRMKKAIHLTPISPPVWYPHVSGLVLYRAGSYEEAIPKMKEALRVMGTQPRWFFRVLGGSYWRTGQYDEAIAAFKKALDIDPDYLAAHKGLAISYSLAGHEAEARTEVAEILKVDPKWSLEVLQKKTLVSLKNKADKERVINAMRKAGLK